MTSQANVRQFLATGIVGEFARDTPRIVNPWNLNPEGGSAQPNTIGRGFTKQADHDAEAGGSGAFVGVLMLSKTYALSGGSTGTLSPTMELLDGTVGELATRGVIYADISTDGAVGDFVFFNDTTGILAADATTTLASHTLIDGARIVIEDVTIGTTAIVSLLGA